MRSGAALAGARWVVGAALAAGLVAPVGGAASAQTSEQVVVVQLKNGTQAASVLKGLHASRPSVAPVPRYEVTVPTSQVPAELARLQANPDVAFASVPRLVHADAAPTPNNLCYAATCAAFDNVSGLPGNWNQDYLKTVGAAAAWNITMGSGVRVAVLDSGVYAAHPDLAGKVLGLYNICKGHDTLCNDPNGGQVASDGAGHGTHIAGLIAGDTSASANNDQEVAGLGWSVDIDVYKVLDSDGSGTTADVATAIMDAVARGDRVINMSLSNDSCAFDPTNCGPDPDEQKAVEYAIAHNVVVVAAAGNDGDNGPTYPASFPGVLSVAATDNNGSVQDFSQWGGAANIAAPGSQIVSTWNNSDCGSSNMAELYCVEDGTSMSTALVSAAAALMIANAPHLSAPQITELLEATATRTTGGHPINGGVLDIYKALQAESHPPHLYNGYELTGSDGSVYSFGSVGEFGSLSGHTLTRPVVGTAMRADGLGYWLDASDGGVFSFGQASFYGSTGGVKLHKPIVGMAATPDGKGYWLVASDGGIFTFGDAHFYGSTGAVALHKPIVGMAVTPDGKGYWLVASDGGIFTFGEARYFGSTGAVALHKPIVQMAATPDGKGYWLVASDGGIFTFGDAHFYGSTGAVKLTKPITAMAPTPSGGGYWLFASDGGVFTFGNAQFWGSAASSSVPAPIVGAAS